MYAFQSLCCLKYSIGKDVILIQNCFIPYINIVIIIQKLLLPTNTKLDKWQQENLLSACISATWPVSTLVVGVRMA